MKAKMSAGVILSLGFLLSYCATGWAASSPKIGYFDMQSVLEHSRAGKQAKEDFTTSKDKIKAEMDEKAKAFKTAKDELDKKKSVMDESARNKKTKEIAEMQQEGEKFIMESNNRLSKLSNELMAPIVDKVLAIVRQMGKSDKYDYIIETGKGGIVYANDKDDLTKKITEELDRSPIKK